MSIELQVNGKLLHRAAVKMHCHCHSLLTHTCSGLTRSRLLDLIMEKQDMQPVQFLRHLLETFNVSIMQCRAEKKMCDHDAFLRTHDGMRI